MTQEKFESMLAMAAQNCAAMPDVEKFVYKENISGTIKTNNLEVIVQDRSEYNLAWCWAFATDGKDIYYIHQSHQMGCGMMGNRHGHVQIEGVSELRMNELIAFSFGHSEFWDGLKYDQESKKFQKSGKGRYLTIMDRNLS